MKSFNLKKFYGSILLISNLKNLALCICLSATPSVSLTYVKDYSVTQQQIQGSILDSESNNSLVGVTVFNKATQASTNSDFSGKFSIHGSVGDSLFISYLGYQHLTVIFNGEPLIIKLVKTQQSIDEVIVVGYGTQKRSEVTSAVVSVKEEEFNSGGVRSPLELVQGKVAGLVITRTEASNPNAGTSIQLRGMTSLTGGNSPLIVIDGIPGGNIDLLKQGDIESIDVLKDGSAAAIYGTRGNNGVILVTTKKGKVGYTQFDYFTYGQREFVDKKPNYLTAEQYRYYISTGDINENEDYGFETDLYEELIDRDNFSYFNNLSASGGSENSSFRISLNYDDANGIAVQNSREQWGGRINFNQKGLKDKLTFSGNLATNFNSANLLGGQTEDFEQAIQRNPTAPIYNEDGTFYETQAYNNYNPISRLANRIYERNQQTFSGDASLNFKILDQLSWTAFGSYVRDTHNDRYYRSTEDYEQREEGDYLGTAYASKYNYLNWRKTFETMFNYQETFNNKHNLTGLLGYSYQYFTEENFSAATSGFTTDAFLDWNLGAGTALTNELLPLPTMGSFKQDNTLIAFFGRINYNYLDKYFLSAILRREGSSRFGENNRWGNFPAISAGWTITNEEFFLNKMIVNFLKLRIGFGVTGNQDIANYQSLSTLSTGGVYPQNGIYYQTYGPSTNPNPDLKWEEKAEWNLGIDFGLKNNNLTGSLDLYSRETRDLLYNYTAQMPPYVSSNIYTNVGSISNKGIELQLSAVAMKKDNFTWRIDFTGNFQKYKLTQLSNETFQSNYLEFGSLPSPGNLGNAIRLEEGGEVGSFYGKRFAGFTDDGKWLFYKVDGSTAQAASINNDDLAYIGNGVPKYQAALGNKFSYKGFDLTLFFRGKFDFDILNTKQMYFGNKSWLPNNVLEDAFTTHAQLNDDPQYSDYYLEEGSFVKLDNITLGYKFSLKTDYVRNLYVYITGRNVATITGYSGLDPELQDTGFEAGIDSRGFYPRTQSWSVGLNFGF